MEQYIFYTQFVAAIVGVTFLIVVVFQLFVTRKKSAAQQDELAARIKSKELNSYLMFKMRSMQGRENFQQQSGDEKPDFSGLLDEEKRSIDRLLLSFKHPDDLSTKQTKQSFSQTRQADESHFHGTYAKRSIRT